MTIRIEQRAGALRLTVRAQPRASRSEVVGEHDGMLKVRLAAPPVEGEANAELVRLLARALGVAKSAVRIASGQAGRTKVVEVEGLDPETARRLLGV